MGLKDVGMLIEDLIGDTFFTRYSRTDSVADLDKTDLPRKSIPGLMQRTNSMTTGEKKEGSKKSGIQETLCTLTRTKTYIHIYI